MFTIYDPKHNEYLYGVDKHGPTWGGLALAKTFDTEQSAYDYLAAQSRMHGVAFEWEIVDATEHARLLMMFR